jgi:hypothetical protein
MHWTRASTLALNIDAQHCRSCGSEESKSIVASTERSDR